MAATGDNSFLFQAALYFGATAVAVPIFRKLKLGTILGFLAAGIILGRFDFFENEEGVFHVAELGVVLFLFVIGLELSYKRLWSLRRTIFGLGLLQMAITGTAIGYGTYALGFMQFGPAMILGYAFACSSTAFALSLLEERHELNQPHGVKAFSVLLFQDIAVIPLLAAVPIVAGQMGTNEAGEALKIEWQQLAIATAAILGVIVISRFVLDRVFKLVAVSGSREAFTAAALFVVAATALVLDFVGLSMALGAFIAGVMLAESSFRHQIESDIEPFRELLLGLFFIGVGMQLDMGVIVEYWWVILAGAAGLIAFKSAILFGLAKLFGGTRSVSLKTAAYLCQGGEFGFVVFSLGAEDGLFDGGTATLMSSVITASMIATPLIISLASRLSQDPESSAEEVAEGEARGKVLIVGFGRMGQLVNHILKNSGVEVTAIDNDPKRIQLASSFGNRVYYGNGNDVNLLFRAGALDADAIVFTLNARENLQSIVAAVRERCPNVRILARVYDRIHEIEMMDVRTDSVVRELYESSIRLSAETLSYLGYSDQLIEDITAEYRERDRDRLLAQKAEGLYAKKDDLHKPFDAIEENPA